MYTRRKIIILFFVTAFITGCQNSPFEFRLTSDTIINNFNSTLHGESNMDIVVDSAMKVYACYAEDGKGLFFISKEKNGTWSSPSLINAEGEEVHMAVDSENCVHLCYSVPGSSRYINSLYYACSTDGQNWNTETLLTDEVFSAMDMVVDSNNNVHILAEQNYFYQNNSDIFTNIVLSDFNCDFLDLEIDKDNTLHAVLRRSSGTLSYASKQAAAAWSALFESDLGKSCESFKLAEGINGNIYGAACSDYVIDLYTYKAGVWDSGVHVDELKDIDYIDIASDSNGVIYLIYMKKSTLYCTYRKTETSNWVMFPIDSGLDFDGIQSFVDGENRLHILYDAPQDELLKYVTVPN